MKKFFKLRFWFLFMVIMSVSFGNDWEFSSRGENIIPIETSQVSIKKEEIRMKIVNDGMDVKVKFIFNSPVSEEKIIGFITPEGGFDNDDNYQWDGEMHFKNFTTVVNGKTVKSNVEKMKDFYKKNVLSKEEMKKYNVEKYKDSYIYYFKANFVKGENTVEHSYNYSGSHGVGYNDFQYVWTTISKWKNKKVDEFELIIEPGDSFVSLPYTFWKNGKKINWEIVGEGKIDTAVNEITESSTNRKTVMKRVYAKLKNGYIAYRTKDFAPDDEFWMEDVINIVNNYFPYEKTEKGYIFTDDNFDYASLMCCYVTEPYSKEKYEKYEYYKADLEVSREKEEELKKLSNKELEILRNYPFALAGYDFSRKDLKDYFSQFIWYYPIGKDVEVRVYPEVTKVVDKIIEERKKNSK